MSAINEWFGAYNIIFRHIKNNFGAEELNDYLNHLGDTAYSDISLEYRENGLNRIKDRYSDNFKKDGGEAACCLVEDELDIEIKECPSYKYMLNSDNPYDKPETYYCDCCIKLNKRVLHNAGYVLNVTKCNKNGKCNWSVKKG